MRSVIVTGAASGFGRAIAEKFSRSNCAVILADIDPSVEDVQKALTNEGGTCTAVVANLSKRAGAEQVAEAATRWQGGVDVLVNNAGLAHPLAAFEDLPEEEFDRMYEVNFKSMYHTTRAILPHLRARKGAIVVTGSVTVDHPRWGHSAYVASKSAMVGLTRALAIELARDGVRCNAVMPVAGRTNGFFAPIDRSATTNSEERLKEVTATIPLGRIAEPTDIAEAVFFLGSPGASFLTGVCLPVDGGRSI